MKIYLDRQKREEERRRAMYDTLSKANPQWQKPYLDTLRLPSNAFKKKLTELLEQLDALPDDVEDAAAFAVAENH